MVSRQQITSPAAPPRPSQGRWSSDLTAAPVGCDPRVKQPIADHPEAGAEQQPRREHKQIGSVHLGPPSVCAFLSVKESAPERKTREATVMIV